MMEEFGNQYSIDWKMFRSGAATHIVAIVSMPGEILNINYDNCRILVNGHREVTRSDEITDAYRDAISARFRANHFVLGIDASHHFDTRNGQPVSLNGSITFEVVSDEGPIGRAAYHNSQSIPLPSNDSIVRVAGPISDAAFLFGGASWYDGVLAAAKRPARL